MRDLENQMSNKKKKARALAKKRGISYQAAKRIVAPETSSFAEQMLELSEGDSSRLRSFACCETTQIFLCRIEPGFSDYEDVRCVHCGTVLGNVRCDWGTPMLVREVSGDANAGLFAMTGSDGTRLTAKSASKKK